MVKYEVLVTKEFEEKYYLLPKEIKGRVDKILEKLESEPYVGKPLHYPFLREKRMDKFRIYYLIYDKYSTVYIVNLSGKKDQQKVINTIKSLLSLYREEIEKSLRFNLFFHLSPGFNSSSLYVFNTPYKVY